MNQTANNLIKGDLFRIVHIDQPTRTAFIKYSDGRTGRVSDIDPDLYEKDDVILSHDNGLTIVPEEVWAIMHLTTRLAKIGAFRQARYSVVSSSYAGVRLAA